MASNGVNLPPNFFLEEAGGSVSSGVGHLRAGGRTVTGCGRPRVRPGRGAGGCSTAAAARSRHRSSSRSTPAASRRSRSCSRHARLGAAQLNVIENGQPAAGVKPGGSGRQRSRWPSTPPQHGAESRWPTPSRRPARSCSANPATARSGCTASATRRIWWRRSRRSDQGRRLRSPSSALTNVTGHRDLSARRQGQQRPGRQPRRPAHAGAADRRRVGRREGDACSGHRGCQGSPRRPSTGGHQRAVGGRARCRPVQCRPAARRSPATNAAALKAAYAADRRAVNSVSDVHLPAAWHRPARRSPADLGRRFGRGHGDATAPGHQVGHHAGAWPGQSAQRARLGGRRSPVVAALFVLLAALVLLSAKPDVVVGKRIAPYTEHASRRPRSPAGAAQDHHAAPAVRGHRKGRRLAQLLEADDATGWSRPTCRCAQPRWCTSRWAARSCWRPSPACCSACRASRRW